MTKSEIKKSIIEKNDELRKLQTKISRSQDLTEVRSLGETIDKIMEELTELEKQLLDKENSTEQEDEQAERSTFPANAEHRNAEILSSFTNGSFSTQKAVNSVDDLALRSNETMVSRCVPSPKSLDLGKYIRGVVLGDWDNAVEERSQFTTSAMGTIIPEVLSAKIIDAVRNTSLFTSAGVPVIPMDTNNLTLARVKKDPEFSFKEEAAEQPEGNNFELEGIELKTKTCYGYGYVSLEAIHSAKNLGSIIQQVFSNAIADSIDKGLLYGQNGDKHAPEGIINDTAVNTVIATNNGYTDYVKAIGKVRRANGVPTVLGINADTEELISLMVDKNGQPLCAPKSVDELKKVVSNQLSYSEENGSDALVFDPNAMVIGVQNHIAFRMFRDTDYCIKNGMVGFQIYSMLDGKAVRPTHITKITGIKETVTV